LKLRYPIEITELSEEDGGGYMATIPQLGKYTFIGDGDSIEEAIKDLEEVKKYYFELFLNEGIEIPFPKSEEDVSFSGKLSVRMPKYLHQMLSESANKNNVSLNSYINSLLSMNQPISDYKRIKRSERREKEELNKFTAYNK